MNRNRARRSTALLSAIIAAAIASRWPTVVRATVTVEQIEASEDPSDTPPSEYAAIDFNGATTIQESGGDYNGITFTADNATTDTYSDHADTVGSLIYGAGAVGNPYVTSVYAAEANYFIDTTVNPQPGLSSSAPAPGTFNLGAQIINNSYVGSVSDNTPPESNLDAIRRLDFMIQQADVTFVAAAAVDSTNDDLNGAYLDWSAYNSLAVSGATTFQPGNSSPGKCHADVSAMGLTSFAAAKVSGAVAGLYGNAQAAGQNDTQNDVVMRSLIMTGADKIGYTRQTANNLNTTSGAGVLDYPKSLAILNVGENPLLPINSNNITGSPTSNPQGWAFGAIDAGSQSALLFHTFTASTGITASLNWDVTQSQPTSGTINTTDAGTIFPTLGLEVRPVTLNGDSYVLGASLGDATLQSYLPANTDNVEYIYSTSSLPAGNYAFMITGDPNLSATVGFSYLVAVPSQWNVNSAGDWNTSSNWDDASIPNGVDRSATLGPTITTAHTVFTDSPITLGTLHFNNANTYVLTGAGSLTMQTSTGNAAAINVDQGTQEINLPLTLASNTIATIQPSATLIIGNPLTLNSNINLNITGGGALTIESLVNLATGASITVSNGSTLNGDSILTAGIGTLPIDVDGTLDISQMSLDLDLQSAPNGQYVLADYADGGSILGQFRSINGLPTGAVIDYDGTVANPQSIVVVVPEPTSLMLLAATAIVSLRPRRPRRNAMHH